MLQFDQEAVNCKVHNLFFLLQYQTVTLGLIKTQILNIFQPKTLVFDENEHTGIIVKCYETCGRIYGLMCNT